MVSIGSLAQRACREATLTSPLGILRQEKSAVYQNALSSSAPSQNLLDEAITLLFAGQDTSAATLSWTLHLLSLYPHVQSKLAGEIKANSGADQQQKQQKSFKDLPYLDAVIKEAMRLYPVAPFVVRRIPQDMTVTDRTSNGSVTLPSDSLACIWIYSLHRNENYWSRPDEFDPER